MSFIDILTDYKTRGLLKCQAHPSLPLLIWNYSEITQYSKQWDDITNQCRGLITDTQGKIIARSFPKFHNIEENIFVPTPDFTVYNKLDGSLGILFYYSQSWHIASRGSFTSEQAIKADELLKKYDISNLNPERSYIFEIIYPENRIVVDYGRQEDLVYLATFSLTEEFFDEDLMTQAGFPIVSRYDVQDYTQIKALNWENSEGFVVKFSNNSRVKVKFQNYVDIHKIVTNLSESKVWEWYSKSESISHIIDQVPDEWHQWLQTTWDEIDTKYKSIKESIELEFNQLQSDSQTQAEFAFIVKDNPNKKYLFFLRKGKDIRDMILSNIRPKGTITATKIPFKNSVKLSSNGTLIILCGISASGKSTWANEYVKLNPKSLIVSRDGLRLMLFGTNDTDYYINPFLDTRENLITDMQLKLITDGLSSGYTVVIDDTNCSLSKINSFTKDFSNYHIIYKRFDIPLLEAIDRDKLRNRCVGEKIITKQMFKYETLCKHFKFEPYAPPLPPRIASNPNLMSVYIFDIDGTLAHNNGRAFYDWKRVGEDSCREMVKNCAVALWENGYPIIICSGRDAVCLPETKKWLIFHEIPFYEVHLRPPGDNRHDWIIKEEMWRELSTRYNIIALFDDRQSVVDHGRRLGLEVFQVAPGNF